MKRKLFILLILPCLPVWAQVSGEWINPGNLYFRVNSDGQLAHYNNEPASGSAQGSDKHFFNFINFWISGYDASNQLHISTVNGFSRKTDFSPGPTDSLTYIGLDPAEWNYVWSINRSQIRSHRNQFMQSGYQPVEAIKNWPAAKIGRFSDYPAPFIDYDGDGLYRPEKGDYPDFPGESALYFIVNDNYSEHKASGGQPLKIELYGMIYTFSGVPNTVFGKYYVINRTDKDFRDIRFSVHSSFRLGDPADNYCGTHVAGNSLFAYNGDVDDAGYFGNSKPVAILTFLNQKLNSALYITNDSDARSGMPQTAAEYREMMNGGWKNGTRLTFGNQGMDAGTAASFVYCGTTDPLHQGDWTENGVAGVRSLLGNLNFQTLNSGEYLPIEFAVTGLESTKGNPYNEVLTISQKLSSVWASSLSSSKIDLQRESVALKNPMNKGELMDLKSLNDIHEITVYNALGEKIKTVDPSVENTLTMDETGLFYFILRSENQFITKKILIL